MPFFKQVPVPQDDFALGDIPKLHPILDNPVVKEYLSKIIPPQITRSADPDKLTTLFEAGVNRQAAIRGNELQRYLFGDLMSRVLPEKAFDLGAGIGQPGPKELGSIVGVKG